MTYTVKNGTWCKDNEKEYYSTTETGLKAALKAGEITPGTRVVVHKPKYHAGQLIQSLNHECPEGCFVPHGQLFDTSIYEELAKVFPDGKLPDLRECVLVCAGRSERTEIINHDEYTAGQFKDDQFAEHNHNVSTTVSDPGHGHTIADPGHGHSVSDPGHGHSISLPTSSPEPTTTWSSAVYGWPHTDIDEDRLMFSTAKETTGISINSAATNVSVSSSTTGVSIDSGTTGITVDTTEEKAGAADKVTHGKQYGVYYYIAF